MLNGLSSDGRAGPRKVIACFYALCQSATADEAALAESVVKLVGIPTRVELSLLVATLERRVHTCHVM